MLFIVRCPGHVEAGSVTEHLCAFYDLMPTFAELAGVRQYVKKYTNHCKEVDYFDGISMLPTLLGKEGQQRHEFLYWEFGETDQMAVRMDHWKLVVKNGALALYDLVTDVGELWDVSARYPEIVQRMMGIIHEQHIPNDFYPVTLPDLP